MMIEDTTVVLPGPAGDVDVFLDIQEVADQFAVTETAEGVPILDPGIEARFPVNTRAPFVPLPRKLDNLTNLEQIDAMMLMPLLLIGGGALAAWLLLRQPRGV
jgi:hypothetical protein